MKEINIIRDKAKQDYIKKAGIICFDDQGTKSNLKNYRNECNVKVENFLFSRIVPVYYI